MKESRDWLLLGSLLLVGGGCWLITPALAFIVPGLMIFVLVLYAESIVAHEAELKVRHRLGMKE